MVGSAQEKYVDRLQMGGSSENRWTNIVQSANITFQFNLSNSINEITFSVPRHVGISTVTFGQYSAGLTLSYTPGVHVLVVVLHLLLTAVSPGVLQVLSLQGNSNVVHLYSVHMIFLASFFLQYVLVSNDSIIELGNKKNILEHLWSAIFL